MPYRFHCSNHRDYIYLTVACILGHAGVWDLGLGLNLLEGIFGESRDPDLLCWDRTITEDGSRQPARDFAPTGTDIAHYITSASHQVSRSHIKTRDRHFGDLRFTPE